MVVISLNKKNWVSFKTKRDIRGSALKKNTRCRYTHEIFIKCLTPNTRYCCTFKSVPFLGAFISCEHTLHIYIYKRELIPFSGKVNSALENRRIILRWEVVGAHRWIGDDIQMCLHWSALKRKRHRSSPWARIGMSLEVWCSMCVEHCNLAASRTSHSESATKRK